jgi:4-diphosphocytidyl-2-C-methyl-D-erythritol kinase
MSGGRTSGGRMRGGPMSGDGPTGPPGGRDGDEVDRDEVFPARALAPAKVNLGLFLGPARADDGKHELVTVMQSISLADELTLQHAPDGVAEDEVVCPGVPGPPAENLAAAALRAFRKATGWDVSPLRLSIVKRIPVAAGLGGGSADAAAALRLARHASGLGDEALLRELGAKLGADVPAQVSPGRWLAAGAGERLHELLDPSPSLGLLVLPAAEQLSTAAVYAEADRLGLGRAPQALEERRRALRAALELGAAVPAVKELLHNDLQQAAVSLCPEIAGTLTEAREAGADLVLVSGSGPTVVGLFPRANGLGRAERAAAGLEGRVPAPICATSVDAAFARAMTVAESDAESGPLAE